MAEPAITFFVTGYWTVDATGWAVHDAIRQSEPSVLEMLFAGIRPVCETPQTSG
jgi:hypothetical protein